MYVQLICAFVLACAKNRFYNDVSHTESSRLIKKRNYAELKL